MEQGYEKERAKRLGQDGRKRIIDISLSVAHEQSEKDVWADPTQIRDVNASFPQSRTEILILGAGLGGLLYAVRMVQAGVSPQDIRIVDPAGGVGGTLYWNRYPGVCWDIESYLYLPLLEETCYVPKHRYSFGEEIRQYAQQLIQRWNLTDSLVLSTKATKLQYNAQNKEWTVELQQQKPDQGAEESTVHSRVVALVNGPLNWPKLPDIPGLLSFHGKVFHSARWDYHCTGGSQQDPSPSP